MISREDIVQAYRYLLDREPENDAAISSHLNHDSVNSLKRVFVNSREFKSKYKMGIEVGQFIVRESPDVQIECSKDELDLMLAETSNIWSQFGEERPHWSVLTSNDYSPENIQSNIDAFYKSGFKNIDILKNQLKRNNLQFENFEKSMDFGCGVGRLSIPLSGISKSLTSVDVSPGHIELARDRIVEKGIENIDLVRLTDVKQVEEFSNFDLILSLIVLQHNPPPIMAYIYRRLLRALKPGGVAVIQMPTYMPHRFDVKEYLANPSGAMEMHALPQKVIFEIIEQEKCRPVEVIEDSWIGPIGLSHTFIVQKR